MPSRCQYHAIGLPSLQNHEPTKLFLINHLVFGISERQQKTGLEGVLGSLAGNWIMGVDRHSSMDWPTDGFIAKCDLGNYSLRPRGLSYRALLSKLCILLSR